MSDGRTIRDGFFRSAERHPERPALVTCPRCGNHCCLGCWQASAQRCHECLLRDPGPPVPWADPERGAVAGFFATLAEALSPTKSAPALTRGDWREGISFALITCLPMALITGIIPFTHTIAFGQTFGVTLIGSPSSAELGLDVARAVGVGLLVTAARMAAIAVPYLSLTKAYGQPIEAQPARQGLLYRAWLLLLGGDTGVLFGLVVWALPAEPTDLMILGAKIASLLPLMMLFFSLSSTARVAGVGPIAAMVVVIVPFVILFIGEPLLIEALAPILPDSETIREAVDQSASILKRSPSTT